jgi:predicted dehydrogenase
MRVYTAAQKKEESVTPPALKAPYNDAFYYLKAVVRNEIQVTPDDLSSLENNLTVVRILEAAIQSAQSGKVIYLSE